MNNQSNVGDARVDAMPSHLKHSSEEYERLFAVDEDAYEQPNTTRKELWSYYLYYNGGFQQLQKAALLSSDAYSDPQETMVSVPGPTAKPCEYLVRKTSKR